MPQWSSVLFLSLKLTMGLRSFSRCYCSLNSSPLPKHQVFFYYNKDAWYANLENSEQLLHALCVLLACAFIEFLFKQIAIPHTTFLSQSFPRLLLRNLKRCRYGVWLLKSNRDMMFQCPSTLLDQFLQLIWLLLRTKLDDSQENKYLTYIYFVYMALCEVDQ